MTLGTCNLLRLSDTENHDGCSCDNLPAVELFIVFTRHFQGCQVHTSLCRRTKPCTTSINSKNSVNGRNNS